MYFLFLAIGNPQCTDRLPVWFHDNNNSDLLSLTHYTSAAWLLFATTHCLHTDVTGIVNQLLCTAAQPPPVGAFDHSFWCVWPSVSLTAQQTSLGIALERHFICIFKPWLYFKYERSVGVQSGHVLHLAVTDLNHLQSLLCPLGVCSLCTNRSHKEVATCILYFLG